MGSEKGLREAMASVSGSRNDNAAEEASSPDMLKNTPSNIRRLAHEIEQFEGRHKYLAQTTSPSDGGDVRWYFCKTHLAENELAASVPRSEIVGKGDYFRFGMRDSLAIEASFLQREEELLSIWWKEYAECSVGPRGQPGSYSTLSQQLKESSLETEEERVGVPVKGGLYEVDLVKRHCFPVYWSGENHRVLRGHWFARKGGLDWLPLREDVAEQLEFAYRSKVWHRRTFQPSGLFAARVDLQGSNPGLHALFTGEDDSWEAWLNADASGLSTVITLGANSIKLRRGYVPALSSKPTQDELRQQKEEEMDDYCSQVPVRHLLFMVHGIGQRLEKSNLVDDVIDFREVTASLAERHLSSYQLGTQRVLFIPCQWRKGLKLSSEHAVERITLDGVRKLRVMLSATVHDVLYYMSPIYCQAIIDSVSNQLNRLYLKFLKRNPGYDGKVSIYGHSLGSVLSYDILCHQETLSSPFPMECMYEDQNANILYDPNTIGLSSDCTLASNVEEDRSNVNDETNREAGITNQGDPRLEPCFLGPVDNQDKNSLNPVNPLASSDSDILTLTGGTCEPMNINDGVVESHEENIDEEVPENDKDKQIELLKEEIDLLQAKIKELESTCGAGNVEKAKAMSKQPISDGPPLGPNNASKSYTPYIKYTKLAFKVDTFFTVGSPLGVFLSLRNVRIGIGKGKDYWEEDNINEEMPACRQMFNIFHPFDPVAYRIEPLVCKEYVDKRPVIIPYHRGEKRLYVRFQEFREGLASHSQALMDQMTAVRVKVLTICESRNKDNLDEGSENVLAKEERSYGSIMMERVTGSEDGRIDHSLQDKTFRHPYLSALGSHTNYWRDPDTALFILKHLYRDIPEEPQSTHAPQEGTSEDGSGLIGWSEQRDEELPLTFADKVRIKDFSSWVRSSRKR
ncbi:phospholipase SGR2-like isoform X2 [Coffea arabica]|uniref:Phospholipase SGR2-like isoform X2 n=1 Tax=Coffea arabica TaxID=13443 RepID=A0A6P6UV21_COFAR|nr:phospholipase SGR2-like isoform X2 [Coffea arabica]